MGIAGRGLVLAEGESEMIRVSLKNIHKFYGSNEVVRDFSFEIRDKEFIVLVGPSGCGKSTTLRMIAGLEDITKGDLFISEKRMNPVPPGQRGVAMVFQDYALYPHMNVYENMAFGLTLKRGLVKSEIEGRINEAAEMLDLKEYLGRKPSALSGGQRQRVAMGRALVKKADVFLFDEPLSNLDAKLRSKMRSEIKKFHMVTKTTTVYVTHDQLEAMTLADRIVVMNDGVIEQVGTPTWVFDNPRTVFVATFIGSPAMNLFNVTVVKKNEMFHLETSDGHILLPVPESKVHMLKEGMEVVMGIRPHEIKPLHQDSVEDSLIASVDMVELLGKNAFAFCKSGLNEYTVEMMGGDIPKIGENVGFHFNMNAIHLFDPKSGLNLAF